MNKRIKEIRYIPAMSLEVRDSSDDVMAIKGYVVKFNDRSQLLYDEWYERVAKGAFAKSL